MISNPEADLMLSQEGFFGFKNDSWHDLYIYLPVETKMGKTLHTGSMQLHLHTPRLRGNR